MQHPKSNSPPGVPIDASGGPTFDPSFNVLALSTASNVRQDDLRIAANELVQMQLRLHEKIAVMREGCAKELAAAEARRLDQLLALRSTYEEKLRVAEAGRIDAIRAVDVNNVSVASQRASDAASVLQNQVVQTADTLRNLVTAAATATATTLQQLVSGLSTRIETLEKGSYQAQGRQSYSDPAFLELLSEVKRMGATAQQSAGKDRGVGMSWAAFAVAASLLVAIAGVSVALFHTPPAPTYASVAPK